MADDTLLRALLKAGHGPRRMLASAIMAGEVMVNGVVALDLRRIVDSEVDLVTLNGQPLSLSPISGLYLMLNKPRGVLCTTRDDRRRTSVTDLLPQEYRDIRLHAVGRLDRESRGLLLLTNDGALTQKLTHPRFRHEKEYRVATSGRLDREDLGRLRKGVALDDGMTSPAGIEEIQSCPPTYRIIIREGRNRQVRRMFAAMGRTVVDLQRVRIGGISLGELPEGTSRELTEPEIATLTGYESAD